MTLQQAFVVLDTQPLLAQLIRASEYYTTPRPLAVSQGNVDDTVTVEAITVLSPARARLILQALYNEALSQQLRYRTAENALPVIAQALRDCAVPTEVDLALAEDFICQEAVDAVCIEVSKQISNFVADSPWRQWDLVTTSVLMALVGGQDYRIAEYERLHGYDDEHGKSFSVDIRNLMKYLQAHLGRLTGSEPEVIPVTPLIVEAIEQRYPLVSFKTPMDTASRKLQELLGPLQQDFYQQVVRPATEAFQIYFLLSHLDTSLPYTGEITAAGELTFHAEIQPRDHEELYYCELKQSIERGDWVPEAERRKLDEYERTRTY